MFLFLALAGLGSGSSEDELQFTTYILFWLTLWALFLPIITFDHPPQWMVLLQPVLLIVGLLGVHFWLRTRKFGLLKRSFIFLASYCAIMSATNMAGPARGIFYLAGDAFDIARAIHQGRGWPADTRP